MQEATRHQKLVEEAGLLNPHSTADAHYKPNEMFPACALESVPALQEFITKKYFEMQKLEQRNICDAMLLDPNRRNTNDVQNLIKNYFYTHFDGHFRQY